MPARAQIIGDLPARGIPQPRERYVRGVFASFRLQPNPLEQSFLLGLQFQKRRRRRYGGDQRARLAAAERRQAVKAQLEMTTPHAAQQDGNVVRKRVVDIPDEAQRQMIIFRIDPSRPGQTAAHQRKLVADMPRYFETCEKTGHDTCGPVVGESQQGQHGGIALRAQPLRRVAAARPCDQFLHFG